MTKEQVAEAARAIAASKRAEVEGFPGGGSSTAQAIVADAFDAFADSIEAIDE